MALSGHKGGKSKQKRKLPFCTSLLLKSRSLLSLLQTCSLIARSEEKNLIRAMLSS